jgi:hypothetical protein
MTSNSENSSFSDWRSSFEDHPQFNVLKNHIDRAVQDLFLVALRTQGEEFIHIFDSESKIQEFSNRMIKYWEREECYEICAEILVLSKELKSKWRKLPKKKADREKEIRDWLKSSF